VDPAGQPAGRWYFELKKWLKDGKISGGSSLGDGIS
jgi:hypothetical protein